MSSCTHFSGQVNANKTSIFHRKWDKSLGSHCKPFWSCERGSPRSVVRPTPLVRTERPGLLRRLEPARSTFDACSRNFSNSWDSRPNCSLWLRHFSSRSRTFDCTSTEQSRGNATTDLVKKKKKTRWHQRGEASLLGIFYIAVYWWKRQLYMCFKSEFRIALIHTY